MPLVIANARKSFVLLPVAGSNTSSGSGVLVVVGGTVVSARTVVVVGVTVVVVVGMTVVVVVGGVVVVVVVGFAVHWAYSVKSAVWLCAALVVIPAPPDAAVNQPANV